MKTICRNEDAIIFQNTFFDIDSGKLLSPIETQNYRVIQVGESYYKKSFQIKKHSQCCDIELTFPLTNGLCCDTDGVLEKLNKGEIYISFRGDCHELSGSRSCRFQTLAVDFKNDGCLQIFKEIKEQFQNNRKLYAAEVNIYLTALITDFLEEDRRFFQNSIDSLITLIFLRIARNRTAVSYTDFFSPDEKLTGIINYIDVNFLNIYSLNEISKYFGYTYSHICKLFKRNYGITPADYLMSKKFEYALVLLKEGKTVVEVAGLLGYSSPCNFSRAFKNFHGVSPTQYYDKEMR